MSVTAGAEKVNPQVVETFLGVLASDLPPPLRGCLWFLPPKHSHTFATPAEGAALVAEHGGGANCYVGIALADRPLTLRERVTNDRAAGLLGLGADLDFRTGDKPLGLADRAAAERLLASLPLSPSLVVSSGHGLQAWWLWREPWVFESAQERQEAQTLARAWGALLREIAQGQGSEVDSAHDLARLLRLPGTVNVKRPEAPLLCELLHTGGPCYNPLDFADLAELARHLKSTEAVTTLEDRETAILDFPTDCLPARFEKLLAGDSKLRDLYEKPASDGDQSARDYALACRGLEKGLTEEETATALWLMPFGKRRRDGRGAQNYVIPTVQRAAEEVRSKAAQGPPPTEEPHLTDTGNAERLVAQHGRNIRYCWPWRKWLIWTGKVWKVDAEAAVLQRAKRTVQAMYREAARLTDDDQRVRLAKHVWASESAQRRKAMVELAQSEPEVACDHTVFDIDPWLLNCRNGTLDLRIGDLRPHQREDYLTKLAPVEYDPNATCPQWEQFLQGVFEGNAQLIDFVQRAAGYCLSGDVSEDALFFLHGTGANGKTTLFLTLQALLGAYAVQVSPGLLLTHYYETHPTGLMDLFGVRLAVSVEVGEGRRFDEERLKQITGGDRIRARRMRENFWEFEATHKIWLAANAKPRVIGQDYAIWRRIKLIPFNMKFTEPGEPGPDRDPSLRKNLFRDEWPGILNWALAGCLSWQLEGLLPPSEVQAATADYKREEDVVQQFIEGECIVAPEARENPTRLFKAYERWRKDTGAVKLTQTAFGRRLSEKGFKTDRDMTTRWRRGISLAEQPKLDYEETEYDGFGH